MFFLRQALHCHLRGQDQLGRPPEGTAALSVGVCWKLVLGASHRQILTVLLRHTPEAVERGQ